MRKLFIILATVFAVVMAGLSPAMAAHAPVRPTAAGVGPVVHDTASGLYAQAAASGVQLSLTPLDPNQKKLVQRFDAYASHTLYWSATDSVGGHAYGRVLYSISYPYLSVDQVWYDSNYSPNGSGPNLFGSASGDVWGGGNVLYRQWSWSGGAFNLEFYWPQSYHVGTSTNPTEVLVNGYDADGGYFSTVLYMWT